MLLLNNAAATGPSFDWPGGTGIFKAIGTFSGATVTLQCLASDGVTYMPVGTDTTLSAVGGGRFMLDATKIRALISGGPPSAMYATAEQFPTNR